MSRLRTRDAAFARVFGENLTRCREQLELTQEDLGFYAGLHRTAIGQLERGERVARTDTLLRLCGSLGVGPEVLLAGLSWRPARIAAGELQIEPMKASQPEQATEEKPARDSQTNQ